jgi:hypothetical protein
MYYALSCLVFIEKPDLVLSLDVLQGRAYLFKEKKSLEVVVVSGQATEGT